MAKMKIFVRLLFLESIIFLFSGFILNVYADKVSITVPMWFSPSKGKSCFKKIYDEYSVQNNGIKLNINTIVGSTEKYVNTLKLMVDSGNTTDLAIVPVRMVGELASSGYLLNLSGKIPAGKKVDFLGSLLSICKIGNDIFGLPYDTDVMVIYYNKSVVNAHEIEKITKDKKWNWDTLIDLGKTTTLDTDKDGQTDIWGFGFPAARSIRFIDYFLPWYFSAAGLPSENFDVTNTAVKRVLNLYRNMVFSAKISPFSVSTFRGKDIYKGLINGYLAMAVSGSWIYNDLSSTGSFGILPIPSFSKKTESSTYCGGWAVVIFKKNISLNIYSLRLANQLTSKRAMVLKWKQMHYLPVLKSILKSQELKAKWPDSFFAKQLLEHAKSFRTDAKVNAQIDIIQDTVQYMLIKNYSVEDAIRKVKK